MVGLKFPIYYMELFNFETQAILDFPCVFFCCARTRVNERRNDYTIAIIKIVWI